MNSTESGFEIDLIHGKWRTPCLRWKYWLGDLSWFQLQAVLKCPILNEHSRLYAVEKAKPQSIPWPSPSMVLRTVSSLVRELIARSISRVGWPVRLLPNSLGRSRGSLDSLEEMAISELISISPLGIKEEPSSRLRVPACRQRNSSHSLPVSCPLRRWIGFSAIPKSMFRVEDDVFVYDLLWVV